MQKIGFFAKNFLFLVTDCLVGGWGGLPPLFRLEISVSFSGKSCPWRPGGRGYLTESSLEWGYWPFRYLMVLVCRKVLHNLIHQKLCNRETGEIFVCECPGGKRTKEVLEELITKHVETGSVILTDGWQAYRDLARLGEAFNFWVHLKCNWFQVLHISGWIMRSIMWTL